MTLCKGGSFFRSQLFANTETMFFKIGAPKNLAIFTGKHQCWSLFLTPIFDSNVVFFLWILQSFFRAAFFIERLTASGQFQCPYN